ncbi:hypothetical protein NEMIN01_2135 [Nematocida minor]|uniref:uncharacterized protein n=1 Tax=Nematocida minor TaxID=1912983 RepID=UPI00221FCBF6|nr:uncharacterized protein NEMIN01_2135 [Nematocida minor]KAI5192647.1 hypothetical protein NEMIN01_2135 [Nematocida minor]
MNENKSSTRIINKPVDLSLEDACTHDLGFLERSKSAYEAMKTLKKDIETHERKKKNLELQIERLRISFVEYVQSIETIEKSEIYTRALPSRKLNHSRILKYSHLFMPPSISPASSIDASLVSTIKKACLEYKQARAQYESLQALQKPASFATEQIELEWKFQIYEKKVNFAQSKMSFSIETNKLTLCLLKAISTEVEEMQKTSIDHAALCLSMQKIKDFQYSSSENAISPLIAEELQTLTHSAVDELERQKRKITNEYRPVNEEKTQFVDENRIKRKLIPNKVGFLLSNFDQSPIFTFFANFRNNGKVFRGMFYFFKNVLVVKEMVFGWTYSILRNEVNFFKPSALSVSIETVWFNMEIFCEPSDTSLFCSWYSKSFYDHRKITLIGTIDKPLNNAFLAVFENNPPSLIETFKKKGYTLLDSQLKENRVRKRVFLKRVEQRLFFINILYTETYTIDENTNENTSIVLYSDVSVFRFLPNLVSISKLYLKSENNMTAVYYCFEKSLNSFILWPVSRLITRRIITSLHLVGVDEEDIVKYNLPSGLLDMFSINLLIGGIAVIAGSSVFIKLLKLVLNYY